MLEKINAAIVKHFGNDDFQVTSDKWTDARLVGDYAIPDDRRDKVAAFIFCTFPEIKTIAWGGVFYTRESMLRFAFKF